MFTGRSCAFTFTYYFWHMLPEEMILCQVRNRVVSVLCCEKKRYSVNSEIELFPCLVYYFALDNWHVWLPIHKRISVTLFCFWISANDIIVCKCQSVAVVRSVKMSHFLSCLRNLYCNLLFFLACQNGYFATQWWNAEKVTVNYFHESPSSSFFSDSIIRTKTNSH